MMIRLTSIVIGVSLLAAALQAESAQRYAGAIGSRPEKVYRHAMEGAVSTLDPTQAGNYYGSMLITAVYDTLYDYKYLKRPYEIKPNIADGLPVVSLDGLVYTIRLKKNIHFANDLCFPAGVGRELTAHDFVFSMKRHFDPKSVAATTWVWRDRIVGLDEWGQAGADYAKEVEGLKALDRYTVQIKVKNRFPQLLYTLAMSFASIVPREAVTFYGQGFARHPVGSGPFRLAGLNSKKAVLLRNPDFRQEIFDLKDHGYDEAEHGFAGIKALSGKRLPLVDRIEVSFLEHPTTRWNSFTKRDEIQFTLLPSDIYGDVVKASSPLTIGQLYGSKYNYIPIRDLSVSYSEFNMAHPDFGYHPDPARNKRNKALRCAIRKAYDWQKRLDKRYHGLGMLFPGIIPPGVEGFDPELGDESIKLDVEGAKALLAGHGWKADNLPTIVYAGVASMNTNRSYTDFRDWLEKIGYPKNKIRLRKFANFPDYLEATKKGELNIHNDLTWYFDYPDAENILQLYYGPNKSPGVNHASYQNPEYDELFKLATLHLSGSKRAALYKKANKLLIDDCVVIGGLSPSHIVMWHKNVQVYPSQGNMANIFKYIDVSL